MDCAQSVFCLTMIFDTLDEKIEGIILIIGLRLGQKQEFLLSERLRCSSILNPTPLVPRSNPWMWPTRTTHCIAFGAIGFLNSKPHYRHETRRRRRSVRSQLPRWISLTDHRGWPRSIRLQIFRCQNILDSRNLVAAPYLGSKRNFLCGQNS